MSLPGRSSFCSRWWPLIGLETFRLLLLVSSLGVALFLSPFLVFGRCLSLPFVLSSLFSVAVSSGFCGLSSGRAPLVSLSGSSAVLLSCCFFSFLSSFPRSLHALLLAPFLRMPSVSFFVLSWRERFLQLVALFLLLLARPTLLPLPFRLHVLILPFVCVGCVGWQRLGFSPQCSFVFLTCGPFLISFRLSSFYHSDVQLSSSSVYGLGSLLGKRFFTLGFTCSHF